MANYIEFLVHGDERELGAWLRGYAAGSGGARPVVFAHEAGFQLKKLRERIKHHGEVRHVIVADAHGGWLRAALAAAAPRYHFEVREERRIARAYFHFEFDTPSEKVADRIKHVFATLPAGVTPTDFQPREVVDPAAKGAEVYTVEHHYRYQGEGVLEGDVEGVVRVFAVLSEIDFVKCDEIEVHHLA
jgi:hypothetical protein